MAMKLGWENAWRVSTPCCLHRQQLQPPHPAERSPRCWGPGHPPRCSCQLQCCRSPRGPCPRRGEGEAWGSGLAWHVRVGSGLVLESLGQDGLGAGAGGSGGPIAGTGSSVAEEGAGRRPDIQGLLWSLSLRWGTAARGPGALQVCRDACSFPVGLRSACPAPLWTMGTSDSELIGRCQAPAQTWLSSVFLTLQTPVS